MFSYFFNLLLFTIQIVYPYSLSSYGFFRINSRRLLNAATFKTLSTRHVDTTECQLRPSFMRNTASNDERRRRVKLENYFFKSHCGLYWIQTLSSLLASVLGTWSVSIALRQAMVHQSSSSAISNCALPFVLMRRCLLTALSKYVTGFGAIILSSAAQIRSIGLHRTRTRIRKILTSTEEEAIAQYLFYCAILLVWTRPPKDYNILPWYMRHVPLVTSLLGAILLRKTAHVAWVISDIMVIISRGQKHGAGFLIHLLHSSFAAVFNGWMKPASSRRRNVKVRIVTLVMPH
jgi:hypothetical protein